jgi:hypothetical protein
MYNDGPTLFATNCTLVDNSAYDGGSLYNSDGALVLTNSTLSNNSGGIRNDDTATVRNTIIANSTRENCRGKPLSTDSVNNLSTDNTCSVGFTQVTAASLVLGALIGNPAYIPLNPGSVAVDAGTNHGCPSTDQRGWLRPYDGDGDGIPICDVGSFELVMLTHNLYLPITLK